MGAHDRRRHIRGGDRNLCPAPTQQHVCRVDRMGSTTSAEELDVRLHRSGRSHRRRGRFDLSPPLGPVLFQPASPHRVGEWRQRDLADHVGARPPAFRDRRLHPRKPQRRRPRRGVHGARSLGGSGRRPGPVRGAPRRAGGPGAGDFSHQAGSRAGDGLPGLAAWQWVEGRRFLARETDQASSTS